MLSVLTCATACSSATDTPDTDSPRTSEASRDLSGSTVDEFVSTIEGYGQTCLSTDAPKPLRACIAEGGSYTFVSFDGADGEPERVFFTYTYSKIYDAAVDALLPGVSASDMEKIRFEEDVVQFGAVAVRGGDHVVVARSAELAKQPFPDLPLLDGDAAASALEQAYGMTCEGTSPEHTCDAEGVSVEIGPEASLDEDDQPVVLKAEIDQEFTSEDEFEGVPEFFDAIGMPLTQDSQQLIADCNGHGPACAPTFINDDGLLVTISPSATNTTIDITPVTPVV